MFLTSVSAGGSVEPHGVLLDQIRCWRVCGGSVWLGRSDRSGNLSVQSGRPLWEHECHQLRGIECCSDLSRAIEAERERERESVWES